MAFNYALSRALRRAVADWGKKDLVVAERSRIVAGEDNQAKRLDLLVTPADGRPVVVESSYEARDADLDARSRLGLAVKDGSWILDAAVSVCIHEKNRVSSQDDIYRSLLQGQTIRYAAHQRFEGQEYRWPKSGHLRGDIHDLADFLQMASLPRGVLASAANEVADLVRAAGQRVERLGTEITLEELCETISQPASARGVQVVMVLWLNALMIHKRLHRLDRKIPSIESCIVHDFWSGRKDLPDIMRLVEVWYSIWGKNWRPVFGPALTALRNSMSSGDPGGAYALQLLVSAVDSLAAKRVGPFFNVGAELFPRLAEDRKASAAFYTTPAAAEFLAAMTIPDEAAEWSGRDPWSRYVVADLACGTGTLLRAAYRRVRSLHQRSGKATRASMAAFHKRAMEVGLVGQDISAIAVHLASSSLAALGGARPYGETRIDWLPVGDSDFGDVQIGSLEYLEDGPRRNLMGGVTPQTGDGKTTAGAGVLSGRQIRPSVVLMNPPYSRTKGGMGTFAVQDLSPEERKRCQERWGQLAKKHDVKRVAGMAASFLVVADRLLREAGRLGFVLPLSAASAESWSSVRRRIEKNFRDIVAITTVGHSLSADTGMEEMLLIAEKRASRSREAEEPKRAELGGRRPASMRCVALRQPLDDAAFSGEIARAVKRALRDLGDAELPVRVGDEVIGAVAEYTIHRPGEPWSGVGAARPRLAEVAATLARGELTSMSADRSARLPVPMSAMAGEVAVGPTHHLIGHLVGNDALGAFELHRIQEGVEWDPRALWGTDAKLQKAMRVRPTHWGAVPKALEGRNQRSMLKARSTLFCQRNMRWTSQSILFATTRRIAMGGRGWTALSHENDQLLQALALWGNSTLGMLVHWTRGQRAQLGRSPIQIRGLKKVPAPRLSKLPERDLARAATAFQELRDKTLLPACQAHCDPARREIDRAVLSMLGLPGWAKEALDEIRLAWCKEPSVHGGNRNALRKLSA